MNQGNTARSAKVQFLKMFFWIPFIAVIAVIFPRSRRPNSRYRGTATTAIYPCACCELSGSAPDTSDEPWV